MKQRIRKFLLEHGGHASAVYIVRSVLHLRHATPVLADRVLKTLLADDPDFVTDGLGNWHLIASEEATSRQQEAPAFCIVETLLSPREIITAKTIVLGWIWPGDDGSEKIAQVAIPLAANRGFDNDAECSEMTPAEFAEQVFSKLRDTVIVSWQITATIAALQRILGTARQIYIPAETLSLRGLAKNLLGLSKRPTFAMLRQHLPIELSCEESLTGRLRADLQLWQFLRNHSAQQGIQDWQQLVQLARQRSRLDFTAYHFDEDFIRNLPQTPGVYWMKDERGRVVYVGKAGSLRNRVRSYFQNPLSGDPKLQKLRERMRQLHYRCTDTELDALLMEHRLITRFRPPVNIQQEVQAEAAPPSRWIPAIMVIPVFHTGKVIVYFLSPHCLLRISVTPQRKIGKRLVRAVEQYWGEMLQSQETGGLKNETSDPRVELAYRWFKQNRGWISWLDPMAYTTPDDLLAQLHTLMNDPDIFAGTVLLQARNEIQNRRIMVA